jgi:hypothetical protein
MNLLQVSVWRGGEDCGYRSYEVPRQESQSVLDVVTYIQRSIDPTLSYRFAGHAVIHAAPNVKKVAPSSAHPAGYAPINSFIQAQTK